MLHLLFQRKVQYESTDSRNPTSSTAADRGSFCSYWHLKIATGSGIASGTDAEGAPGDSFNGVKLIDPRLNELTITDKVFLDLRAGPNFAGRITLGLYGDITAITVANIKTPRKEKYAGTAVYRIAPSLTIQMGDVLRNGGAKGRSGASDGNPIPAENYVVSHTIPGIVSMARRKGEH